MWQEDRSFLKVYKRCIYGIKIENILYMYHLNKNVCKYIVVSTQMS